VLIRRATADDLNGIVDVHVASWDAAKDGLGITSRRSRDERARQWAEVLASESTTLVAEDSDGAILGFLCFGPSRDEDRRGEVEIYTLYVEPDRWRQGVGSALIDRVPESGVPISLWTSEGSAQARGFYARHGFQPDGATEAGHHVPQVRLVRACASERPV
jgi:GNAT superfamily N-acetyltransferase